MSSNVSYTVVAQATIEKIRALRQEIPNFIVPASPAAGRQLAGVASVPPQFVEMTAAAVTNNPVLSRAGSPDPDSVRDLVSYGEAYTVVADELEALAGFVRHSVASAKHKAGRYALTTYAVAKRLAKEPETADLAPLAATLYRELGRKGRKSQPAPTKPETPTTPQTTSKS